MGFVKDIFGVGCSAVVTGGMFLGAPIIGILYGFLPGDLVDSLTTSERPAVYFDGAYTLSDVEIDGDLDGTTDADVVDPEDEPENTDEVEGVDENTPGEVDPKATNDSVGGEVAVDPVLDNGAGTRAGGTRGGGLKRPQTGKKVTKGTKRKKSRRKCVKNYDGIQRNNDGSYNVSRRLVNHYTASIKRFNELGWSRANDKGDGKGWYISGFGCNDALYHGGLRRGDVVLTVNGKKTNNMMQVFLLYSKVKTKKHFVVKVRRKGKDITLRYNVVRG